MAKLNKNFSSLEIPKKLDLLYSDLNKVKDINGIDETNNRLERNLNLEKAPAFALRRYLKALYLDPELEKIDDSLENAEEYQEALRTHFRESVKGFLRERRLAKSLYQKIQSKDYNSFYTELDEFLGGDFFPKTEHNGKVVYNTKAAQTKWVNYANNAYKYLQEVIDKIDPDNQSLTLPAEFSSFEPELLLKAVFESDNRTSFEAIVLLKIMLLDAWIDQDIAQLADEVSYKDYFLREIGKLTEYLSKNNRLFTKAGQDYVLRIHLDPDLGLRVCAYKYKKRNNKQQEDNSVLMSPENGDYFIDYFYSDWDPFFERESNFFSKIKTWINTRIKGNESEKGTRRLLNEQEIKNKPYVEIKRTVRFIKLYNKKLTKIKNIPVIWDTRPKPRNSLRSKLLRKDQRDINNVSDVSGGRLIFLSKKDALEALPKILEVLPLDSNDQDLSNNLFTNSDLTLSLDEETIEYLFRTNILNKRNKFSDLNFRSFKYNTNVNNQKSEIQITILPYYINENLGLGMENHDWYRLRQYLDQLFNLLFYRKKELNFNKSWLYVCKQIYDNFLNTRQSRKAVLKSNNYRDFIENHFIKYLLDILKAKNFALLDKGSLYSGKKPDLDHLDFLPESLFNDEEFNSNLEDFRESVFYNKRKLINIAGKSKGLHGHWGKEEMSFNIIADKVINNALLEFLVKSFLTFTDSDSEYEDSFFQKKFHKKDDEIKNSRLRSLYFKNKGTQV